VWYRLGEGSLGIDTDDAPLAGRFDEIYGDCRSPVPGDGPRVVCQTRRVGAHVTIAYDDPEPLDEAAFTRAVFPGRTFAQESSVVPAESSWQPLVANLAVSRLLRLQRGVIFFHAASFAIGGNGVMVCGPKRSGKTTIALGIASRGHALLGDEVAALRLADRKLLPFRRSLAVREGPVAEAAVTLLDRAAPARERFPDGETRRRVAAGAVSEADGVPVPLTAVVILRHFKDRTEIQPLPVGPGIVQSLTPMAASLWDRPAGATALRLIGALSRARIVELYAGPPDEALAAIETLMEAS
jgi:hypothetical protein